MAEVLPEHGEDTNGLAGPRAQGAREDLVGKEAHDAAGRQLVDDDRVAANLRHRQELPMGAGYELRIGRAMSARAQQRDALLRHDQCRGRCTHVLDGLLQNGFQVIRTAPIGAIHSAVGEQELEVPVARAHGLAQGLDGDAGQQVPAEAFERGPKQGVGEGEAAALLAVGFAVGAAHDRNDADHQLGILAQPAQVNRELAVQHAHLPRALWACARRLQGRLDQIVQIRAGRAVAGPAHPRRGIE